jgi:endonuclease YncB( thermonuclease family)
LGGLLCALAILAIALSPIASGRAAAQDQCQPAPLGSAEVTAVRDGRTLMLADGRELRLAAIEAADDGGAALRALTAGRALRLGKLGAERDRYGRLVALAFAGDAAQSLQQLLLAQGAARVSARIGDKACAAVLLAAEKEARDAHRGLWADPNFAPLAAENLSGLRAKAGHFALVEGKVLSVRTSGPTIYLNFGYRWTRDFSVVIPRRSQGNFAAGGVEPKGLEGRRVRVRGWIDRRSGPVIEADGPEQIELID